MKRYRALRSGFTLIELLIVIGIIGVLITISAYAWYSAEIRSRDDTRKLNLSQIQNSLEQYDADQRSYPSFDSSVCNGSIYSAEWQLSSTASPELLHGSNPNPRLAPTYISQIPSDPSHKFNATTQSCGNLNNQSGEYLYITTPSASSITDYALMATLENTKDPAIINNPFSAYSSYSQSNVTLNPNYVVTGGLNSSR